MAQKQISRNRPVRPLSAPLAANPVLLRALQIASGRSAGRNAWEAAFAATRDAGGNPCNVSDLKVGQALASHR
ncbi:MAG: hypothetical protein RL141_557 [Candidatus Parcubacteria bacterium]|jgi:hypothetical protein